MQASTSKQASRSRRSRAALLGCGLALLALAAGELAARAWLGADFRSGEPIARQWKICGRFDPRLGWSNRPLARARIVDGTLDYRVRINSQGWRDRERSPRRAPGVARILALGDSLTWGWGVDASERFSELLEQRLAPQAEVWNTSTPGWGTDQELWAFEDRLRALEPDVVVLCLVFNDLQDVGAELRYDMRKPRLVADASGTWRVDSRPLPDERGVIARLADPLRRELLAQSALCLLALSGGNPLRFSLQQQGIRWQELPVEARELRPAERALFEARCQALVDPRSAIRALLEQLRAGCAAIGCELLLITLPHQHDPCLLDPRYPRPALDAQGRFQSTLALRLHEAGLQLGVEVQDFERELLERSSAGEFLDCGDSHLNAAGHRVVADALEPRLREILARRQR